MTRWTPRCTPASCEPTSTPRRRRPYATCAPSSTLPDRAEEIVVTVFPDQDGEGTFDVVVSLDAPDAAVLDRAIAPHRTLFEVVHGEDGPVPEVPLVAPGRAPYDARDVVVDTAADWIVEVWDAAARGRSRVRGVVDGHGGHGTSVPRALAP